MSSSRPLEPDRFDAVLFDLDGGLTATLGAIVAEIKDIQRHARETGSAKRPQWPMIIMRTYFPPDANTLLSVANHCLRHPGRARQVDRAQ